MSKTPPQEAELFFELGQLFAFILKHGRLPTVWLHHAVADWSFAPPRLLFKETDGVGRIEVSQKKAELDSMLAL